MREKTRGTGTTTNQRSTKGTADTCLYFAYGVNMDEKRMRAACPTAVKVGVARLTDHRFITNTAGLATVMPCERSVMHGVLWSLPKAAVEALRHYEGVKKHAHHKKIAPVADVQGNILHAVLQWSQNGQPGQVSRSYLLDLITAATAQRFPSSYLMEMVGWLRKDAASMSWISAGSGMPAQQHGGIVTKGHNENR
jgi:hypothetical protein